MIEPIGFDETEDEYIARLEAEIGRLRLNHRDVVETKRRTEERLRIAIKALHDVTDASNDPYEIARNALPEVTGRVSTQKEPS